MGSIIYFDNEYAENMAHCKAKLSILRFTFHLLNHIFLYTSNVFFCNLLVSFHVLSMPCSSVGVGGDGLHGVRAGSAERESSQPVGRSGGWERLRAPGLSACCALPGPEQPH